MSETLTLMLAWAAGGLLGAIFFGGLWWTVRKGVSSDAAGALVLRQPAAANEHGLGRLLLCFGRSLAAAAALSPWIRHGEPLREVAHAAIARRPEPPGTGGPPCALLPMR